MRKTVLVLLLLVMAYVLIIVGIDTHREYKWCGEMDKIAGMEAEYKFPSCEINGDPLDLIIPEWEEWLYGST